MLIRIVTTFYKKLSQNAYGTSKISFLEIFQSSLDRFAPYKYKKVRYNNNPVMTEQLTKEMMVRSKQRNDFNKSQTSENWKKYKQQRNKCLSILKGAITLIT